MSISFKQFLQVVDLSDEEFYQIEEGLSDVPGFGWLKGADNKAKLAKIDAERAKLKNRRDAKSKELDAQFAALKADVEGGKGPMKKGTISNDDLDDALPSGDRKFNAKNDRFRDQQAAAFKAGMQTR